MTAIQWAGLWLAGVLVGALLAIRGHRKMMRQIGAGEFCAKLAEGRRALAIMEWRRTHLHRNRRVEPPSA